MMQAQCKLYLDNMHFHSMTQMTGEVPHPHLPICMNFARLHTSALFISATQCVLLIGDTYNS